MDSQSGGLGTNAGLSSFVFGILQLVVAEPDAISLGKVGGGGK